jgi:hypothetical protein
LEGRDKEDLGTRPALAKKKKKKARPDLKKYLTQKKGWWSGTSGRAPAYQV